MPSNYPKADVRRRLLKFVDDNGGATRTEAVEALAPTFGTDTVGEAFDDLRKRGEIYEQDTETGRHVKTPSPGGRP